MTAYWSGEDVTVYHGNCVTVMAGMPEASVDAIVCDPPYELAFMSKRWDATGVAFDPATWAECLRVLKPGAHCLAFGGSRTFHRLACAIEDAGFEIRDSIAWLYGSGFPKSLDVGKAIDKQRTEDRAPVDAVRSWLNARRIEAGWTHDGVNAHFGHARNGGGSSSAWMTNPTSRALPTWEQWQVLKQLFGFSDEMDAEAWRLNGRKGKPGDNYEAREVLETRTVQDIRNGHGRAIGGAMYGGETTGTIDHHITAPATDAAKRWQGWGTALKPAFEPVVVARKPPMGTVAQNVTTWGTGALNIDATKIGGGSTSRDAEGSNRGDSTPCTCLSPTDDRTGRTPSNGRPGESEPQHAANSALPSSALPDATPHRLPLNSRDGYQTSPYFGGEPVHSEAGVDLASVPQPPDVDTSLGRCTSCGRNRSGKSKAYDHSTAPDIQREPSRASGRWPANVVLDTNQAAALDKQTGTLTNCGGPKSTTHSAGMFGIGQPGTVYEDAGGPSRFFYVAKAPTTERPNQNGIAHPTVKPIDLMQWLVRLVTPPGGTVLDPFAGSGTTGEAAVREGFKTILIEQEADYLPLILERFRRPINYIMDFGDGEPA